MILHFKLVSQGNNTRSATKQQMTRVGYLCIVTQKKKEHWGLNSPGKFVEKEKSHQDWEGWVELRGVKERTFQKLVTEKR